jgi:hypothetical protein
MAKVYGITKRLEQNNINEEIVKEIIGNGDLVDIIIKMENMLDPEITYQILDSCACGISLKEIKGIKEIKAESIEDKIKMISLLGDFHSDWNIRLNQDNTLTAGWIIREGDNYACVCSAVVNVGMKVSDLSHANRKMPLTYCFCCAGHCRRHLQKLLDIQLKTKKIVSSPINSNGQKPCEFIFEII